MTTKTYFQTTLENKSIYPLLRNSDKKDVVTLARAAGLQDLT